MTDREKLIGLLYESDFTCNQRLCEECDYLCSNKCKASMMADHLLANGVRLETEQATSDENKRWISVSERLPEIGDRCLCNVKSFAFPGSFYQAILKYDKYGFVEDCIYTDDVTHWMPLPEPPREDE